MNLYLFNANDSAATYGIGSYLKELTQALEGGGLNIHIVHLHAVKPEFEIVKTNHVENWYIPEVRNHSTFSGSVQKLEDYYHHVVYLLRLHIRDTKDLIFHFNFNQSYFLYCCNCKNSIGRWTACYSSLSAAEADGVEWCASGVAECYEM